MNKAVGPAAKDFDRYAAWRPHFQSVSEYPSFLEAALAKCSGVFLDNGTGDDSRLYDLSARRVPDLFASLAATNISAARIAHIRPTMPNVKAFISDGSSLPLADSSVDYYFSDQVIEHVPSDIAFLQETKRVMAPGGRAFSGSVVKRRGGWYIYRCNGEWSLDPTHIREYTTTDDLLAICRTAVLDYASPPVRFPLNDHVLRLLVALRLVDPRSSVSLYSRNRLLPQVRSIRLTIPNYEFAYVLVTRA